MVSGYFLPFLIFLIIEPLDSRGAAYWSINCSRFNFVKSIKFQNNILSLIGTNDENQGRVQEFGNHLKHKSRQQEGCVLVSMGVEYTPLGVHKPTQKSKSNPK